MLVQEKPDNKRDVCRDRFGLALVSTPIASSKPSCMESMARAMVKTTRSNMDS